MNLHDQETFRRGKEEGILEGRAEGIQQGIQQGRTEGIQQGIQQGRTEGIQQGIAKGEHQAKIATAKNFLAMGISVEQIAAGTGLPVEEVQGLTI